MNQSAIDTLLEAAVLAPSGDNTQPWQFAVDRENRTISVEVDPARDPSPMNAGQRMAWIAVGAAVENMVQTADHHGWKYQLAESSESNRVIFQLQSHAASGALPAPVVDRLTNRQVYRRGEIPPEVLMRLQEAVGQQQDVACSWIVDQPTRDALTRLIARGDALMFGAKVMRDAFLANVRFDQPANAVVDQGLALGTLGVSAVEQRLLKLLRYVPDGVLHPLGGRRVFASTATRLAQSASGLCVLGAGEGSPASGIAVGRVWQRAWLALTAEGLAAQPMMSLCVLQNVQENAEPAIRNQIGQRQLEVLLEDLRRFCDQHEISRLDALMRFGFAQPPTTRAGRLTPQQLMTRPAT